MTPKLGVAIITFQSPDDAAECLKSVLAHTLVTGPVMVWDNSQDFKTGVKLLPEIVSVEYIRSPYNVGTCISRNAIAARMIRAGCSHWVVMDQDVRVTADGWLDDMLAVFTAHPDTGCVSWRCISDQLCKQPVGPDGEVPQVAGACSMFSAACVRAIKGWDHRALFYRMEDTAACFAARDAGFRTRLVLGDQKIVHDHPGSGMARHPRGAQVRALSEAIFRQMAATRNWPAVP